MSGVIKHEFLNGWELSEDGCGRADAKLEVNVVFTDPKATLAALRTAAALAQGLDATISVLAVQAAPYTLPLEQPPVSTAFTEKLLIDLVRQQAQGPIETTVHLYLCRDKLDTLGQVLAPNSLVVIGGRRRWWPSDAAWIARMLRSVGHEVIWANVNGGAHARLFLHSDRGAILRR